MKSTSSRWGEYGIRQRLPARAPCRRRMTGNSCRPCRRPGARRARPPSPPAPSARAVVAVDPADVRPLRLADGGVERRGDAPVLARQRRAGAGRRRRPPGRPRACRRSSRRPRRSAQNRCASAQHTADCRGDEALAVVGRNNQRNHRRGHRADITRYEVHSVCRGPNSSVRDFANDTGHTVGVWPARPEGVAMTLH